MFGSKKPIDTINTHTDPVGELRKAVYAAVAAAERAGVQPARIRDYLATLVKFWDDRARHRADLVSNRTPISYDGHGNLIDLDAKVARAQQKRDEARLAADQAAFQQRQAELAEAEKARAELRWRR
jgi:hypothetical protein